MAAIIDSDTNHLNFLLMLLFRKNFAFYEDGVACVIRLYSYVTLHLDEANLHRIDGGLLSSMLF